MFKMIKKIFVETYRATEAFVPHSGDTRWSGKASLDFLGEADDGYTDMTYPNPSDEIVPYYRSKTDIRKERPNDCIETKEGITERWSLDLYSNGSNDIFVNLKDIINILSHCSSRGFNLGVAEDFDRKLRKGDDDYYDDNEDRDNDDYYDGYEDEYQDDEDYDRDGEYDE